MTAESTPPPSSSPEGSGNRKVALVTGAGKRLGRSIALGLAQRGWDLALHYLHSAAEANDTAALVRESGGAVALLQADLCEEPPTRALFSQALGHFGRVDALVNNASRFSFDSPESCNFASIASHWLPNLAAPLVLAQALHAHCHGERRGVVVNILDQKLLNPNTDFFAYTLSKAALLHATDLMARHFAPRVRVVGVSPGITLPSGDQTDAGFLQAHAQTPLGRSSTPNDVVAAIVYLLEAPAVTGVNLVVDGGQHLWPSRRDVMFLTDDRR